MRRAERLFEIIELLRRARRPVTAHYLAEELEVSIRTIYRDMAALQAQRVPIAGEAGIGYILRSGYDLPPLMFNEDEIEAMAAGIRIIQTWADPDLAKAARRAFGKIATVVPDHLKPSVLSLTVVAPPQNVQAPVAVDLARLRESIRGRRKIAMQYQKENGEESDRIIWPQSLAFYGPVWLLFGWCELRQDFRVFRADRIQSVEFLEEEYDEIEGRGLIDYIKCYGGELDELGVFVRRGPPRQKSQSLPPARQTKRDQDCPRRTRAQA